MRFRNFKDIKRAFRSTGDRYPGAVRSPAQQTPRPYYYLGDNRALTQLTDGHFIYVDTRDETISPHLVARGYWEVWIRKVVTTLISEGDHVVDVGANLGYYTLALAAIVGPKGSVTALEANPRVASLLQQTVTFNGYGPRVKVLQQAASNEDGMLRFSLSVANAGGGHIFAFEQALGPKTEIVEVQSVKLDSLPLQQPKLIRIDAEGSEALILLGAERLLARPDIVVCMEWDVLQMSCRSDVSNLIDWLTGLGFRFWRITPQASLEEVKSQSLPDLPTCDVVLSRLPPPPLG
jgi:FkbM family methyltransferase